MGLFGDIIQALLLGLVGFPGYIIPFVIIINGIFIIFKKDSFIFKTRLKYLLILLLLISAIIHTGYYDKSKFENAGVLTCLRIFYNDGRALAGGGILGGIISTPFLVLFQATGTIIILTTISIIDIILLTNMSIANFINSIRKYVNKGAKGIKGKIRERYDAYEYEGDIGNEENLEYGQIYGVDENISKKRRKIINFQIAKQEKEMAAKSKNISDNENDSSEDSILDNNIDSNIEVSGYMLDESVDEAYEHENTIKSETEPDYDNSGSDNNIININNHKEKINSENIDLEIGSNNTKGSAKNSEKNKESNNENTGGKQQNINIQLIKNEEMNYKFPPLDLMNTGTEVSRDAKKIKNAAIEGAKKLEETLRSFQVEAKVINVSHGPAVTRYELQPGPCVKVNKIVNLTDDIALNLASAGVRIEAPIPGKAAIGIEVANSEIATVYLRDVISSDDFVKFPTKLAFALGKDISGDNVIANIEAMPHLLIAGATGSGKSVCINSLIISILYKANPNEVKLLMVDPKVVELGIYNGIPHLLIPVVTDPKKAASALNWAVQEMMNRYKLFAEKGVRDMKGYNSSISEDSEETKLPHIVIIIDELADLMMVAPNDVEDAICRLAQMARAAGIHLVIATQRPSVDVITGVIKANIPSRISFAVSSQFDSRTILDMAGAERLLGKGDMLFYPVGKPKPIRVQGAYISDKEVERIVEYVKTQSNSVEYNNEIMEHINSEGQIENGNNGDVDELLSQAIELVVEAGQASVSMIQRKFKVGYNRAARIIDQMEERGIVGRSEGSKPRQVLITKLQLQEMQARSNE